MTSADITEDASDARVDETTALLATSNGHALPPGEPEDANDDDGAKDEDKPLPINQISLLCFARLVDPVAFFCIIPFINQMIWDTGEIAETDAGFYSGLIESLFSLTQMFLMIPWGKAADFWGRKPVLVSSLAGVAVSTALFGLSKTIWQMILFRCLAGVFSGTVVTIRTMISENSTSKTQARAFSLFAFTSNLGIFLGPVVGGVLARPATEYPAVFGRFKFFHDYPYALPTLVTGSIALTATITSAVGIKETLIRTPQGSPTMKPKPKMSTLALLRSPGVAMTLYIYSHVMLLALAYTAIAPVCFFTSVHLGGFGFTPLQIAIMMGLGGLSQSLWLLIVFPWLQARIGTAGVMRLCATAYPFFFLVLPLGNLLLRRGYVAAFWAIAPFGLCFGSGVSMSFTAIQLVLNDVSPGPEVLGTLNAVSLTLVSGIRAFTPALFASLYAASIRSRVIGGHLIWILLIFLAAGFTLVCRWVPEPNKAAKTATDGEQDGET